MSDPEILPPAPAKAKEQAAPRGPSLRILYGLLALALAAAIGFALLIVRPFFLRR